MQYFELQMIKKAFITKVMNDLFVTTKDIINNIVNSVVYNAAV